MCGFFSSFLPRLRRDGLSHLERRTTDLEIKMSALSDKVDSLTGLVRQYEDKFDALKTTNGQLSTQVADLNSALDRLKVSAGDDSAKADADAAVTRLTALVDEMTSHLDPVDASGAAAGATGAATDTGSISATDATDSAPATDPASTEPSA